MGDRKTVGVGTLFAVTANGRFMRFDINHRVLNSDLPTYGKYVFVVNENVHQTGRRLRGLLVSTWRDIGYIVKAEGTHAVFQPLLPVRGSMHVIDMYDANVSPLQQIGGPCIWDDTKMTDGSVDSNGFVCMSPGGPTLIHVPTTEIPVMMLNHLRSRSYEHPNDYSKVYGRTRCPDLVPVVYVKCTEERRKRVSYTEDARRYTIPIGGICDFSKWYVFLKLFCCFI